MTDALAATGMLVGLVGAGSLLLQARRLLRLGSACEISLPVRVLTLTGYTVWLAYGLAVGDIPLIVVDAAGVLGAALLVRITLAVRRRRPCPPQAAPRNSWIGDDRARSAPCGPA